VARQQHHQLRVGDEGSQVRVQGEIDPGERVVVYITGEGLKTLDAVRGTFEAWEIEPTVASFEQASKRVAALA